MKRKSIEESESWFFKRSKAVSRFYNYVCSEEFEKADQLILRNMVRVDDTLVLLYSFLFLITV